MKKTRNVLIGIILLFIMSTNVMANVSIEFTSDSKFEVGKTVTVDIDNMKDMDSTIYNAWLEGKIEYKWYLNGSVIGNQNKKSLNIIEDYLGKEIHVKVICTDTEYEGGPYEVTGEMLNPPVGTEELEEDIQENQQEIENNQIIGTQTDDINIEKNESNILIYVGIIIAVLLAFVAGFLVARKGKITKNEETKE